jgi:hypothetical protein
MIKNLVHLNPNPPSPSPRRGKMGNCNKGYKKERVWLIFEACGPIIFSTPL